MLNRERFSYSDDGAPVIRYLHDERRKARTEKACTYCRKPILKGEMYRSFAYTEDGEFRHDAAHRGFFYCTEDE